MVPNQLLFDVFSHKIMPPQAFKPIHSRTVYSPLKGSASRFIGWIPTNDWNMDARTACGDTCITSRKTLAPRLAKQVIELFGTPSKHHMQKLETAVNCIGAGTVSCCAAACTCCFAVSSPLCQNLQGSFKLNSLTSTVSLGSIIRCWWISSVVLNRRLLGIWHFADFAAQVTLQPFWRCLRLHCLIWLCITLFCIFSRKHIDDLINYSVHKWAAWCGLISFTLTKLLHPLMKFSSPFDCCITFFHSGIVPRVFSSSLISEMFNMACAVWRRWAALSPSSLSSNHGVHVWSSVASSSY